MKVVHAQNTAHNTLSRPAYAVFYHKAEKGQAGHKSPFVFPVSAGFLLVRFCRSHA